jgi:hypothetical protein
VLSCILSMYVGTPYAFLIKLHITYKKKKYMCSILFAQKSFVSTFKLFPRLIELMTLCLNDKENSIQYFFFIYI